MTQDRKAMEQSIWIVISIVIALATALCVIMLLTNTTTETEGNITPIIKDLGNSIKSLISGE